MGRHTWMGIRTEASEAAGRAGRRVGRRVAAMVVGLIAVAGLGGVGAVAMAAPATTSATPCAIEAKACVRLSTNEAWLTDGKGHIVHGPVRINHGAPGSDTPTGTFHIQRQEEMHLSKEYNNAKMPWSSFFDDNGRAIHGGDPARQSAGCVRMVDADAKAFYEGLAVYDTVQILP